MKRHGSGPRPRGRRAALLCAAALALAAAEGARSDELADLRGTVEAQGQLIEQLRGELERVRAEQKAGEDRMRALEDQRAAASGAAGVSPAYVDSRIEAFETNPESRFLVSGYGTAGFMDEEGEPSSFGVAFNPGFHWRMSDRLHFNAEFRAGFERHEPGEPSEFEFDLEFAQIDFLLNDWAVFSAGHFLIPFNQFGPRLHPDWINKMASTPPIYGGHGHGGGIVPILSDFGAVASGGIALWNDDAKLNYAFYVANGPTGEALPPDETEALELDWLNAPDLDDNKSVGGRIGFLPIANLEIGGSFMTGKVSGTGDRFHLAGADAVYYQRGLELRGEYIWLQRTLSGPDADVWGYYVQAAYRLAELFRGGGRLQENLARFEPVLRWGQTRDLPGSNRKQLAVGLDYWLYPSVPLKFTYEINSGAIDDDRYFLQFAYGF